MKAGLAGGFLWALDTVILSLVLAPFSLAAAAPLAATACHDLLSALWLALYNTLWHRWRPVRQAAVSKDGRRIMLAALLGGPAGMAGYVMAIRFLGPGLAAAISSCYPVAALAGGALFFHEKVTGRQIAGMALCLVCVMLLSGQASPGPDMLAGLGCAFLCVMGWAGEGLLVQSARVENDTALFVRQCTSALVFFALVLPAFSAWGLAGKMLEGPGLLAAASLAGTASYLCYYLAIRQIGAARAMPLNITYCAWAVILAWAFGQPAPQASELVLCAGVIAGGALAAMSGRQD